MNLSTYKYYYFLGIGGIGMSAIARYIKDMGYNVSGYDRVRSELCEALENEGMEINYTDSVDAISTLEKENTLIIYTPAIPKDSTQLNYFKNNGFTLYKRSQILGLITEDSYNISVAGTHGKTTTSSLIAHLLHFANKPFGAFLGGISTNLGSNYYNTNVPGLKGGAMGKPVTVTEADEFDRSFLTLSPNLAIVTSMDADHLDIYGTGDELKKSFFDFIKKIEPGGTLFIKQGLDFPSKETISIKTYGIEKGDFKAINVRIENGWFTFDFEGENENWESLQLGIPGTHNIENAVAAIAVCLKLGIDKTTIVDGLKEFKGVKRRFEFICRQPDFVFIDDYAHHPTELEAFIKSVKLLYPNEKITGVFQPHLYSRTKDFAEGFAQSLSLLDVSVLLDIYPARELPMPGVTSSIIHDKVTSLEKYLTTKENVIGLLEKLQPKILLTIGAGDIDTLVSPINEALQP
ncbi:MAG: UDP-N-acetylmuramate--L-alanine ligase [Bacteroidia bacterium]